jgi:hypothetical protein
MLDRSSTNLLEILFECVFAETIAGERELRAGGLRG